MHARDLDSYRQRVLDLSYSYWRSRILHLAAGSGIFEAIGTGRKSAGEIARARRLNAEAVGRLLNALAAMGMLKKTGVRFEHTRFGKKIFLRGEKLYVGDILRLNDEGWEPWGRLEEALKTGKSLKLPTFFSRGYKAVEGFIMAMDNTAKGHASALARLVPLKGAAELLDLGGGSGAYSIEFVKRNPGLRATLFDLPHALKAARKLVRREGLAGRFCFKSGDFMEAPIKGRFDVVFMSHILHGLNEKSNRKLIRKLYKVLNPGGRLIIQDFFLDPDMAAPEFPALFSLNMLIHTEGGRSYSLQETKTLMRKAGFRDPRLLKGRFPRGINLLSARK